MTWLTVGEASLCSDQPQVIDSNVFFNWQHFNLSRYQIIGTRNLNNNNNLNLIIILLLLCM